MKFFARSLYGVSSFESVNIIIYQEILVGSLLASEIMSVVRIQAKHGPLFAGMSVSGYEPSELPTMMPLHQILVCLLERRCSTKSIIITLNDPL